MQNEANLTTLAVISNNFSTVERNLTTLHLNCSGGDNC